MTTNTETVVCVYDDAKELVGVIKRDEPTGHKLVYTTKEASVEGIVALIGPTSSSPGMSIRSVEV